MKVKLLTGAQERSVIARSSLSGREQFGQSIPFGHRYARGGVLAHTVAFKDDSSAEVLDEAEFQAKVLGAVEDQNKKFKTYDEMAKELTADLKDAPKKIVKLYEEIEKLKKVANDSQVNFEKFEKAINKFDGAMKKIVRAEFGDPLERFLSDEQKRNWVNAVVRACAFPNQIEKLPKEQREVLKWAEEQRIADQQRGVITGADSSLGQATVPTEWLPEIYSLLSMYGIWNTFQTIMNISARTTTIPMATARPQYYWIGSGTGGTVEGAAITEGSFTGTSVNLTIQTLAAFIGVSRELIQDSAADISAFVSSELFQSIAYGLDFAALQADATADQTDAGYRGVFDAAALNTNMKAAAAAGNVSTELTDLDDWERCRATVNARVLGKMTKWWMHPFILSKAILVRDLNGRPIFQTALEAPAPGSIGRILGSPVVIGDACPSTNTVNAKIAVFGDPEGMAVGIRQDFELATSAEFRFSQNQICYRALTRAGVQIKSATGSTVLKPFAVLTLPAA